MLGRTLLGILPLPRSSHAYDWDLVVIFSVEILGADTSSATFVFGAIFFELTLDSRLSVPLYRAQVGRDPESISLWDFQIAMM